MPVLIAIPPHYAKMLQSDQEFRIYSLVSNFNIVEAVLCKIDPEFIAADGLVQVLNFYLAWVLEESKVWRYLPTEDFRLTCLVLISGRECVGLSFIGNSYSSNVVGQSVWVPAIQ